MQNMEGGIENSSLETPSALLVPIEESVDINSNRKSDVRINTSLDNSDEYANNKGHWTPIMMTMSTIVFFIAVCLLSLSLHFATTGTIAERECIERPTKQDIQNDNKIDLRIVSRKEWLAVDSNFRNMKLGTPIPLIVIAHTATENCTDRISCSSIIKKIQKFYIDTKNTDVPYNFFIGGDGTVYEGCGWNVGQHTDRFNFISLGIALIGTFDEEVNPIQLNATKNAIDYFVSIGKIVKNFKLFGQRQIFSTDSPGSALFAEIKQWPHFSETL